MQRASEIKIWVASGHVNSGTIWLPRSLIFPDSEARQSYFLTTRMNLHVNRGALQARVGVKSTRPTSLPA